MTSLCKSWPLITEIGNPSHSLNSKNIKKWFTQKLSVLGKSQWWLKIRAEILVVWICISTPLHQYFTFESSLCILRYVNENWYTGQKYLLLAINRSIFDRFWSYWYHCDRKSETFNRSYKGIPFEKPEKKKKKKARKSKKKFSHYLNEQVRE